MKRFLSIFLALCLLLGLSVTAFAADTSRAYTFDLTANGVHEISVKTGDIITVTLELERTSGSGAMYAMQDEINYDDKYLSLQSSGELLYTGCKSSDISLLTGGRKTAQRAATALARRTAGGIQDLQIPPRSGSAPVRAPSGSSGRSISKRPIPEDSSFPARFHLR